MQNPYANHSPADVRQRIRAGELTGQTSGMCHGYAQANLLVLPRDFAYDFLLFAQRNPKPCPLLEVTAPGQTELQRVATANIATDFPRYRIYRDGVLCEEPTDASPFWRSDLVGFLLGCSFSFEGELLDAGVPVRHIEEGKNVPMFNTNIACDPAGALHGNLVVSMRPLPPGQISTAVAATAAMQRVHGAPVHIGDPAAIGIADLSHPDYGDAVTIHPHETPVFWACGVTPQAVVMASRPPFAITHAPGHMLITDLPNRSLLY